MQAKAIGQKLSAWNELVWRTQNIFRHVLRRFMDEGCSHYAAILTSITLLSLIPISLVLFFVFSYTDFFSSIEQQLDLLVTQHANPHSVLLINHLLGNFAEQTGNLFLVSLAFLVAIAMGMLRIVDEAINKIFRVHTERLNVSNFLLYWSILTLCPLLVASALFSTFYHLSSLGPVNNPPVSYLQENLLIVLPIILNTLVLTLLYITIPNRRVNFSHAFIGGLVTAVMGELFKSLITAVAGIFSINEMVYMIFSLAVILFFWVYVNWMMLFGGALLVHGLSSSVGHAPQKIHLPPIISTLVILSVVLSRFKEGSSTEHMDVINEGWQISRDDWDKCTTWLEAQQLICCDHQGCWMLSQSLDVILLSDVFERSPWPLPSSVFLTMLNKQDGWPIWFKQLISYLQQATEAQQKLLDESLSDLYSANNEKALYQEVRPA